MKYSLPGWVKDGMYAHLDYFPFLLSYLLLEVADSQGYMYHLQLKMFHRGNCNSYREFEHKYAIQIRLSKKIEHC